MSVVLPIEVDVRYRLYTASSGQKQFAVPFPFQAEEDVSALLRLPTGTYTLLSPTLYAITGVGDPAGGMITFDAGRATGDVILVLGDAILERLGSIVTAGKFNSQLTDDEFDRNRIIQQEHDRDIMRAVKVDYNQPSLTLARDIEDGRVLMKVGLQLVPGPNAEEIAEAHEHALAALQAMLDALQALAEIAADDRLFNYKNNAVVEGATVPGSQQLIRVGYHTAEIAGGGAQYRFKSVMPAHPARIQSADGKWWENAEPVLNPAMLGALYDGATGASTALNNTFEAAVALGHSIVKASSGILRLNGHVDFRGLALIGDRTIIDTNGFETRNIGGLEGVIIAGYRQDKPFRGPGLIPRGGNKFIRCTDTNRFYVATTGPRGGTIFEMNRGNVADPSLPTDSVNGSWEAWRMGLVLMIERGGCFAYTKTGTETGAWTDYTPPASTVSVNAASIASALDLKARRSQTIGNKITYPVVADSRGMARVGFVIAGTAATAQAIKIDGAVAKTVNLTQGSGLLLVDVPCPPGAHTLEVEHTAGANLYVLGANIFLLNEDGFHARDLIDFMACYQFGASYVLNRGAHDYAFRSKAGLLWAGSYHGGETASLARHAADGQVFSMTPGTVKMARGHYTLFQATNIAWPSAESLALKTETVIGESQLQMFITGAGDVQLDTGYPGGMIGTNTNFQSVTIPEFFGNVETEGPQVRLGPTNMTRQVDPASGRAVTTEISEFDILNTPNEAGAEIVHATSAYNKFYPGWIRSSSQRVTRYRAAFTHTFG